MIEWIQNFIRNYSNGMYFPHIQIKDIIEILIVTIIVYEIMLWIKNTKAWMLLRGMLMLGGFILLAWLFQMNTILYLAKESINVLAIAAIVVFQPDLDGHWRSWERRIYLVTLIRLIKIKKIKGFQMKHWIVL